MENQQVHCSATHLEPDLIINCMHKRNAGVFSAVQNQRFWNTEDMHLGYKQMSHLLSICDAV